MARIWQIRQSEAPDRYGDMDYRKPKYESDEEMEAYECGFEEGYACAMKEVKGERMGFRSRMDSRGRSGYRMDDDDDMGTGTGALLFHHIGRGRRLWS